MHISTNRLVGKETDSRAVTLRKTAGCCAVLWRKKRVFLNEKSDTKAIPFTPQVTLNYREDTLVYKSWLSKGLNFVRQLHLCLHWVHMCVCAHTVLECAIRMDTFELGRYIRQNRACCPRMGHEFDPL